MDQEGNYVIGSSFTAGGALKETENYRELISGAHVNNSSVIYIGNLIGVWGHFITDCMRWMWLPLSRLYSENFSGCKLAYVQSHGFKLDGAHKRFLEILGVDLSLLVPVAEPTQYDKIILPDECWFNSEDGIYFTPEYTELIDRIQDFASAMYKPLPFKKVYFSYSYSEHIKTYILSFASIKLLAYYPPLSSPQ